MLRLARVLTLFLLTSAALSGSGRADGDPASDALYTGDVFLPYSTAVSHDLAQELADATRAAQQAGRPIRVALIAARSDLGAVPSLFGQPQQYARFLGAELQFVYRGRLLVVMPQGAALSQRGRLIANARVGRAVVGRGGDGLAKAAVLLVRELSGSTGPLPRAEPRSQSSSAGAERSQSASQGALPVPLWKATAIAVGGVCALVAAGLVLVRRWARRNPRVAIPARSIVDRHDPYRYRGWD